MSDLTPKEANADAKAAKAKAKAMRPWFKKKRIILPLALVVIVGISMASGGGNSGSTSTSTESSEETTPEESIAKLGDTVIDGDWSYVVSNLKCGVKQVGSSLLGAEAQGQFCIVSISATNNGTKADYFLGSEHKIYDVNGSEYGSDSSAWIYLDDNMLIKEVNPGNTSKGQIVFDVPETADLDYILVKSSFLSDGVKVSLK